MKKNIHALAGCGALIIIASFWLSTVFSELFASDLVVKIVKTTIPWGFLLLIPALIITSGSGLSLSRGANHPSIQKKKKRMPIIALNGSLVLMPMALFLAYKVRVEQLDAIFYSVQIIELIMGAMNIFLLSLNMRDGIALTKARRRRK